MSLCLSCISVGRYAYLSVCLSVCLSVGSACLVCHRLESSLGGRSVCACARQGARGWPCPQPPSSSSSHHLWGEEGGGGREGVVRVRTPLPFFIFNDHFCLSLIQIFFSVVGRFPLFFLRPPDRSDVELKSQEKQKRKRRRVVHGDEQTACPPPPLPCSPPSPPPPQYYFRAHIHEFMLFLSIRRPFAVDLSNRWSLLCVSCGWPAWPLPLVASHALFGEAGPVICRAQGLVHCLLCLFA